MNRPFRRALGAAIALLAAVVLSGCCSDCIKDPPCCKKPAPAPAAK